VLGLFLLTVLANVAYSVVYIADVFIQFSGFRASRLVWRRILMLSGFVFAAILTHFFASGIFTGSARLNPIAHITHHSSSRPTAGITHDVRPW